MKYSNNNYLYVKSYINFVYKVADEMQGFNVLANAINLF